MRPLKPYLLALGGIIAAVFSAVVTGAHSAVRLAAPTAAPQPDLQATRPAPVSVLASGTETQTDRQAPAPLPKLPVSNRPRDESCCAAPSWPLLVVSGPPVRPRLLDQRELLLVGVIELRI